MIKANKVWKILKAVAIILLSLSPSIVAVVVNADAFKAVLAGSMSTIGICALSILIEENNKDSQL